MSLAANNHSLATNRVGLFGGLNKPQAVHPLIRDVLQGAIQPQNWPKNSNSVSLTPTQADYLKVVQRKYPGVDLASRPLALILAMTARSDADQSVSGVENFFRNSNQYPLIEQYKELYETKANNAEGLLFDPANHETSLSLANQMNLKENTVADVLRLHEDSAEATEQTSPSQ